MEKLYNNKSKPWKLELIGDKKGRLFESKDQTETNNVLHEYATEKEGLAKAKELGITLLIDELEK